MTNYYLIQIRNVAPHSPKYPLDTTYVIQTRPGVTNMSSEPKIDGWLGTTDDIAQYAEGEFAAFADALAAIPEQFATEGRSEDEPETYGSWTFESKRAVALEARRQRMLERELLKMDRRH